MSNSGMVFVDGVNPRTTDGVHLHNPDLSKRLQGLLNGPQTVVVADHGVNLASGQWGVGTQQHREYCSSGAWEKPTERLTEEHGYHPYRMNVETVT